MEDTMDGKLQNKADNKTLGTTTAPQELPITAITEVVPAHDDRALATISELRPTSFDKVLEARVYRKWVAVTHLKNGTKKETGFCCILIDRQGDAIQCNMNIRDMDFFNPKIKLGSVYRISEFMCEPTNRYQQTIDNKTSIRFGKITKFEPIAETEIPHHYFNFVSHNQLHSRVPAENASGQMEYPILTDYIGCLGSVGEIKKKGGANEDQTIYRKVDIENLNGNVVEFTMWDKMADNFGKADLDAMEQPVIIAVSSCRVSKYKNYQLAATSATYFYLNPKIPEADESRAQYRARYAVTPQLRICKTPYEDVDKEKFRNRFPLKTLLKQKPETYTDVKFTAEATITSINIKKNWFYTACNECMSKVKEDGGIYRCINHGRQAQPCYRYNFKGFITDVSATAAITFFTPAADDIVGYPCAELITRYNKPDPQEIPPEIFAIEGRKNVFQFHFSSGGSSTEFILDQVFNIKKKDEGTSATTEKITGTPLNTLTITDSQDPEHKKETGGSSKSVKRVLFPDEPTSSDKQKETPPETLAITDSEDAEQKIEMKSRSKSVRKVLFPDEQRDSKKQKATPPETLAIKEPEDPDQKIETEGSAESVETQLLPDQPTDSRKQEAARPSSLARKMKTATVAKKRNDSG